VKRKRFSVEQITSLLQQVTAGMAVGDVCRQVGISEQTFYRWKKTYGGMLPSEIVDRNCFTGLANIKRRDDGTVKVLDFGLAKLSDPVGSGQQAAGSLSLSPTITSPALMTGAGVLLGTAAYMSPEQAAGKPVDKRADIWAFGAVLFEMLTGQRAFAGEDLSITLALVVMKDPDSGWVNYGTYRVQSQKPNVASVMMSPGKHGRIIMSKYHERNQPCPVAVIAGIHPAGDELGSRHARVRWRVGCIRQGQQSCRVQLHPLCRSPCLA